MRAIGLMSGTSADGIDAALIDTDGVSIKFLDSGVYKPYPQSFREQIHAAFGQRPSAETQSLERELTLHHAKVVQAFLAQEKLTPADIDVIGFHGQTILHCPPKEGQVGETFQLGDGQLLADITGIPVVCQFRQNDMIHGGQGAPLVPVFHQALSESNSKPLCVVNIGGVSNVTWIGKADTDLLAMDTGPGNALMDDWMKQHTPQSYDINGEIGASGIAHIELVHHWLTHPYFTQHPPKSLDRDMFRTWCFENETFQSLSFPDQIATLTAFTAQSILHCRAFLPAEPKEWILCGGGAANLTLTRYLREGLSSVPVTPAFQYGWSSDFLEAHAFGFLAVRSLKQLPLTFSTTTGVSEPTTGGVAHKPLGTSVGHVA